jgi:glycogen synthase
MGSILAYSSQDLARTMIRALSVYYSATVFKNMRKNAMQADFSGSNRSPLRGSL